MKRLAILGAGDLGVQVAWHASQTGKFSVCGFFDDVKKKGELIEGIPILGSFKAIDTFYQAGHFDQLVIAIGYNHMAFRESLFEKYRGKIPFAVIIHPSAIVDSSAIIEEGSILYPGCVIDMNAHIGRNVLLNACCVIAHDSSVGDHCFFSPSVSLAGFIKVGKKVNLGIGTIVIDSVQLCEGTKTGAGAVVISSTSEPGLYVGIPAKKIKNLEQ